MRALPFIFIFLVLGCAQTPVPPVHAPIAGSWGNEADVWQFFDNEQCVLLGRRYNVSAKYKYLDGKLMISEAKMQYQAPGFVSLNSPDFEVECSIGDSLSLGKGKEVLGVEATNLPRLSLDQRAEFVGRISEAHRNAVRGKKNG